MDGLLHKREVEIEPSREREKTLHRNTASVKKKLHDVKLEHAPLRWSGGNVDEKILVLEKDVGATTKMVAVLA